MQAIIPEPGALRSEDRARARALKHAARRRASRARHLRPRPGRRSAPPRAGLEIELYEFPPAPAALAQRGPRPAPPLRRPLDAHPPARARAVRRRPRPLRPHRLAGVRGPRTRTRADRPRQRHAPPPHADDHRRRARPDRPAGGRLELARRRNCRAAARARQGAGAALRRRPRALPPDPPRAGARASWGSTPSGPTCCSRPTPPARSSATTSRSALAREVDVELLVLGGVDPARAPLWFNAVNAVLMPSGHEGFGLAVLEALACDVPVLTTPSASTPRRCAASRGRCARRLSSRPGARRSSPTWARRSPRIQGRAHAEPFSGPRMAERVAAAWREALERAVKLESGHGRQPPLWKRS